MKKPSACGSGTRSSGPTAIRPSLPAGSSSALKAVWPSISACAPFYPDRKSMLEEELAQERQKTLEVLEENKVVEGTVKNITDYGVFVDLGGIDGLLHITDISWGKVSHPEEIFHKGDRIKVKVIK